MVNTATREAMPNAFLEAAAHGCAILSAVDPDGFASRFGWHVVRDDFAAGLAALLAHGTWRERGQAARRHVTRGVRRRPAPSTCTSPRIAICSPLASRGRSRAWPRGTAGAPL